MAKRYKSLATIGKRNSLDGKRPYFNQGLADAFDYVAERTGETVPKISIHKNLKHGAWSVIAKDKEDGKRKVLCHSAQVALSGDCHLTVGAKGYERATTKDEHGNTPAKHVHAYAIGYMSRFRDCRTDELVTYRPNDKEGNPQGIASFLAIEYRDRQLNDMQWRDRLPGVARPIQTALAIYAGNASYLEVQTV